MTQARVSVLAQTVHHDWSKVTFTISRVKAFRFEETNRYTHAVLSLGIGIHLRSSGVLLDLAPATERPWTREDVDRSHQFVAGDECAFEVVPG